MYDEPICRLCKDAIIISPEGEEYDTFVIYDPEDYSMDSKGWLVYEHVRCQQKQENKDRTLKRY